MSTLNKIWLGLTNPRVEEESRARQEYLTRVIYIMVSAGLSVMTIIVLVINYGIGEPELETTVIMAAMDLLVIVGWILMSAGRWRLSGFLLPLVFLLFTGHAVFLVGPITTAVLQLAIAVLLGGMLSGNRARWSMLILCLAVYLAASWVHGERDFELYLTTGITLFMSLSGIALLDWFFSSLLSKSLQEVSDREAKLQKNENRYRDLFEKVPVCLWEEDLSKLKNYVDGLRSSGVTDLRAYFQAHPEELVHCARLVQIVDVNEATVQVSEAESKEQLLGNLDKLFIDESVMNFQEEIIALYEKGGVFHGENIGKSLRGHTTYSEINGRIVAGYEDTWGKYLVAQMDITERKQADEALRQSEEALRRRAEEMTALQQTVLGITSSVSLPELLQSIVERATGLLGASSAGLYLTEPEQQRVRCVVSYKTAKNFTGTMLAYGEGAAGYVAQTGKPLLIEDYRTWSGRAKVYEKERSFQAIISAPLIWQGEVVGVIHMLREFGQGNFSQEELDLLTLFADHAAVAVQNARLYESLQKSEERFRSLYENSTVGIYRTSPDETIHLANPALVDMLGFSSFDELAAARDLNKDDFGPTYSRADFIKVIEKTGEVKGLEYTWLTKSGREIFIRESARAIRDAQGKTLYYDGIVEDITERKQAETRIHRHMTELEALYENGLAVSRLMEPGEIGQRIADTFSQYLNWQHVAIRLWRGDSDNLTLVAFNQPGMTDQEREKIGKYFSTKINRVGQGLSGHVVETGKPLRTGNVHDHPQYIETHPGIRSGMYMPLEAGGRVIGSISVESEQGDAFSEQDERLLATLSAQAAVAFENAFLFNQTRRQLRNQIALTEAGRTISSALEIDKILSNLAEQFGKAINVTSAYIVRYDVENKEEVVIAEYFSPSASANERISNLGVAYSVLHEPEFEARILSGQHDHSHIDDTDLNENEREHMLEYGVKSILYVPLRVKDQLIGFVELWESREKREFFQEEIDLCHSLSQQAALALENARLYQEAQQELQARKRVEDELKNLLREKEILLAEVHHRVKNNLQVISSLLNLQAEGIEDEHILKVIEESHNRIKSMALVHEQLYRAKEYAHIQFGEYVDQLASTLFNMYQVEFAQIQLQIDIQDIYLDLDKAVPCGLLLNELITNSLKHAFPRGRRGRLWVKMRPRNGSMVLTVGDDGVGIPASVDFESVQTLGLQLVGLLVRHDLSGTIKLERKKGSQFRIEFPV